MAIQLYLKENGNGNDSSGNSNNMTDANMSYPSGIGLGGAARFNGSSSRQTRTTTSALNSNNRTFSLMVRRNGVGSGEEQIIIVPAQGTTAKGFGIRNNAGNLQFLNSDFSAWVGGAKTLSSTKFDYLTAIQDGSGTRLYVNKILHTSDAQTGTMVSQSAFAIGSNYSAAQDFWNGDIDEAIIDNTAWSLAQMVNQDAFYRGFI